MSNDLLKKLCSGLTLNPLPSSKKSRNTSVPHAPDRNPSLTNDERKVVYLFYLIFILRTTKF
jgi:urocanate hydratase